MLVGMLVMLLSGLSVSQQVEFDGHWLKHGIDAHERVKAKKASPQDHLDNQLFLGLIGGMLAAQRYNNFLAGNVIVSARRRLDVPSDSHSPEDTKKVSEDEKVRTAMIFAIPGIPKTLQPQEVVQVIDTYLQAHRNEWEDPAPVIFSKALRDSFAPKKPQ